MITISNYNLTVTKYAFYCPYCGEKVYCGDLCLETEKGRVCVNHLPKRKLIPLSEYEKKQKVE